MKNRLYFIIILLRVWWGFWGLSQISFSSNWLFKVMKDEIKRKWKKSWVQLFSVAVIFPNWIKIWKFTILLFGFRRFQSEFYLRLGICSWTRIQHVLPHLPVIGSTKMMLLAISLFAFLSVVLSQEKVYISHFRKKNKIKISLFVCINLFFFRIRLTNKTKSLTLWTKLEPNIVFHL